MAAPAGLVYSFSQLEKVQIATSRYASSMHDSTIIVSQHDTHLSNIFNLVLNYHSLAGVAFIN